MRTRTALLLPLCLLVGCGHKTSSANLVGTWTGTAGMTYGAMGEDAGGESEQATFFAEQKGQGKTLSLELKADGKAVFANDHPIEGTWKLDGDAVLLTLPPAATSGPGFGGTYRLQLNGTNDMEGPDPAVKGYSLRFKK